MSLNLRIPKGSKLTFQEMDGNFEYLKQLAEEKLPTASFDQFVSTYNTGSFSGSFVGDGSGLTGIPGVTPISTSSFATTGSNDFIGNQNVEGFVRVPGSGSFRDFINGVPSIGGGQSIRGRGMGLYNIVHQGDSTIVFTVTRITADDLTGAITSNLSGANDGTYTTMPVITDGNGQGAQLQVIVSGGIVTDVRIQDSANSNLSIEIHDQPANRKGVGYKVGDTLTVPAGTGGIGGTGNLIITLREQDIETYLGHSPGLTFNYSAGGNRVLSAPRVFAGSNISAGAGTTVTAQDSIVVGFENTATSLAQASTVFGAFNKGSIEVQTIVGIASLPVPQVGAFVVGNGTSTSNRSNLLVAGGSSVEITGSLDVTGSTVFDGFTVLSQVSSSLDFVDDTAAAVGGVPLGGLYRNGNIVQIRLA